MVSSPDEMVVYDNAGRPIGIRGADGPGLHNPGTDILLVRTVTLTPAQKAPRLRTECLFGQAVDR